MGVRRVAGRLWWRWLLASALAAVMWPDTIPAPVAVVLGVLLLAAVSVTVAGWWLRWGNRVDALLAEHDLAEARLAAPPLPALPPTVPTIRIRPAQSGAPGLWVRVAEEAHTARALADREGLWITYER